MTWFRFYEDTINDATVQRLAGDKFKAWVNLLCVASKHEGVLPPVADLAFMLRLGEDKVTTLLDEFSKRGLLDPVEGKYLSYSPHRWRERQYQSDATDQTAASRMQRYKEKKRNARNAGAPVTRNAPVTVTSLDQTKEKTLEQPAVTVTPLIEVTDPAALAAWDDYGRKTTGKPYPRNRRGGWCFPTKWPPGHEAEVHAITGRTA